MERTGWSLTNLVAECVLERWLESDHPVCGWLSVASRLFIEAAATPPHEEGNAPTPDSLVIHSHVLTPWASVWRRFAALSKNRTIAELVCALGSRMLRCSRA